MAVTQLELLTAEDEPNLRLKTWHNGRYGLWRWSQLTPQEQAAYAKQAEEHAQRRAAYVQEFGIYSI